MRSQPEPKRALDLPSTLAYLYAPILPFLKRIHVTRSGQAENNPADILLPQGYTADVVATGFTAPVHCCFDDQGYCYVSESGHKIESGPRILRVDTRTRAKEVFLDLGQERWIKTGALTGDGRYPHAARHRHALAHSQHWQPTGRQAARAPNDPPLPCSV